YADDGVPTESFLLVEVMRWGGARGMILARRAGLCLPMVSLLTLQEEGNHGFVTGEYKSDWDPGRLSATNVKRICHHTPSNAARISSAAATAVIEPARTAERNRSRA